MSKPLRLTLAQLACKLLPPVIAYRFRNLIYPPSVAAQTHQHYQVTTLTGALVDCPLDDYAGYLFATQGYGEWRHWVIALALCQTGDTLLEIGAQFGLETSGFARITARQQGKVYSFEPLPVNLNRLQAIVSRNQLDNVVIQPLAVGERVETLEFVVPPTVNTGLGYVRAASDPADQVIPVNSTSLDSLIGELERVRLLVIDVEGHEIPVLRGGKHFIAQYQPVIVVEATQESQERAGFSLNDLKRELELLDYTVYRINRFDLDLAEPDNPRKRNWNWIALHRSEPDTTRQRIIHYIRRCGMVPPLRGLNPLVMR